MKLNKILMPTDFSECANQALVYAAFLARQFSSELHLLHVTILHGEDPEASGNVFPSGDSINLRLREEASPEMKSLLGDWETKTLDVREAKCRALAPAPAIVEYAAEHKIDLIILGTHGQRGMRRLLLGSVAEEVVRTAGCPVMTLRAVAAERLEPIERIVVPFDFSKDSEWALEVAKNLATTYVGCQIDLVHVSAPPIAPGGYGIPVAVSTYVDVPREMKKALAHRVSSLGELEVPIEPHVLQGSAAWRIAEFAEEKGADLIVMGSHGLSGLSRFLLGSVSERVVRSAHCPVLVLRRPAEAEEANGTHQSGANQV